MSTYLVTGGAGFIGSNLVKHLLSIGQRVVVLDDLSTGLTDNIRDCSNEITFILGDVRDQIVVRRAMIGVDYVLHHAAVGLVGPTVENPILADEVNVKGTLQVLEAARWGKVKRVVVASSAAVYGNAAGELRSESMAVKPESPYAVAKVAVEHYCRVYSSLFKVPTVCLRYFNVYGCPQRPGSKYAGVLAVFVDTMLKGETPTIYGDGLQTRDFVSVNDVVMANILAATSERVGAGECINIGGGESVSINEIYEILQEVLNFSTATNMLPKRPGDIKQSRADITLAKERLKYAPRESLLRGITDYVAWRRVELAIRQE